MAPRFSLSLAAAVATSSLAAFAACSKPSSPATRTSTSTPDARGDAVSVAGSGAAPEQDMNKRPLAPAPLSVVAQALEPKADALAYLAKAQAEGKELKLPVEVTVEPLGISGGFLGFGPDRVAVKIDDTALGVALSDRVASWCGEEATRCAMWMWGKWRDGTILVSRAESRIKDEDRAAATHIHVAK